MKGLEKIVKPKSLRNYYKFRDTGQFTVASILVLYGATPQLEIE